MQSDKDIRKAEIRRLRAEVDGLRLKLQEKDKENQVLKFELETYKRLLEAAEDKINQFSY